MQRGREITAHLWKARQRHQRHKVRGGKGSLCDPDMLYKTSWMNVVWTIWKNVVKQRLNAVFGLKLEVLKPELCSWSISNTDDHSLCLRQSPSCIWDNTWRRRARTSMQPSCKISTQNSGNISMQPSLKYSRWWYMTWF